MLSNSCKLMTTITTFYQNCQKKRVKIKANLKNEMTAQNHVVVVWEVQSSGFESQVNRNIPCNFPYTMYGGLYVSSFCKGKRNVK
jgi:hypothetical protein